MEIQELKEAYDTIVKAMNLYVDSQRVFKAKAIEFIKEQVQKSMDINDRNALTLIIPFEFVRDDKHYCITHIDDTRAYGLKEQTYFLGNQTVHYETGLAVLVYILSIKQLTELITKIK